VSCFLLAIFAKKPTKFGINVFVNSKAKTGYVLYFDIYTGKSASRDKSTSMCHSVVMHLLESYLGKGHWVFVDNYYSILP